MRESAFGVGVDEMSTEILDNENDFMHMKWHHIRYVLAIDGL